MRTVHETEATAQEKGPHNPVDDRLLVQLYKALKIENPHLTKREFAAKAMKNYYRSKKATRPDVPANITRDGIVRHLNRLLAK